MVNLEDIERKITATILPNTPRTRTEMPSMPPNGEVWRIKKIVSLDKPSPDVVLALFFNEAPQSEVRASSIYENEEMPKKYENSPPMSNAFYGCSIQRGNEVHFIGTPEPIPAVTESMSVRFVLTIERKATP